MKATRLLLGFALVVALSATSRANLLTNSDFSAGFSGFTTAYGTNTPGPGTIAINTTPTAINAFFNNFTTTAPGGNNTSNAAVAMA